MADREVLRSNLTPEKKAEVEALWLRFAAAASQSIGAVIDPDGEEGPDAESVAEDVAQYANRMVKEWDRRFNETSVFETAATGANVTSLPRRRRRRED